MLLSNLHRWYNYLGKSIGQSSLRTLALAVLHGLFFDTAFASTVSAQVVDQTAVSSSGINTALWSPQNRTQIPTISAVLKKYNKHNPNLVQTNWIQLSPYGMRILDVDSKSEVLKNFEQQQVWLVNNRNKTSHKIDMDFYREFFPEQLPYLLGPESLTNISGLKPCADFTGVKQGKRTWRGQVVDEWSCQYDDGEIASTQYFSDRWKVVVFVQHMDNSIEELVDIQGEKIGANAFIPDSALRHVEITEFMTGRRLLDSYSP